MLKTTIRAGLIGGLSLAGLAAGGTAHASGFYLQEQSAKAAGRAFSGEVADTGVSELWWNPAAIAGMKGCDGYVNASGIFPKGHVDNKNTLILRPGQAPAAVGGEQSSRDPIINGFLPAGGLACGNGKVAFGVATTSPYSFTTNYNANSWARYTADRTHLRTIDIQPGLAISPVEGLRLGAAVNVEQVNASLSNALPNLSPLLADGEQTLAGSGWNVGYSFGVQADIGRLTAGFSYKSKITHTLNGAVTTTGLLGPLAASNGVIPTAAKFSTPYQIILGARYRATDKLTLNLQGVALGWDSFNYIRLGAPINAAIPELYHNTWSVAGGVDYLITPRWTMRAGVQWDQTPTQNGQRDARVPDADRLNFAAGTSFDLTRRFTIDAAVSYIRFDDATIDRTTAAFAGTAVQTPILVSGTLNNAHALVLSLGARAHF